MLISDNYEREREPYPINSLIDNILIVTPLPNSGTSGFSTDNRNCLLINHGIVMRYYFDQVSSTAYYGISFLHDNFSAKKGLNNLVKNIHESEF